MYPRSLQKAHPWHGIPIGDQAPAQLTAFIEIVPTDTIKYEIDKLTGYLKVDRPQQFSNVVPALYGFFPQTYCGEAVAEFCRQQTGRTDVVRGDGDPLDVCVLSERTIPHGDIILQCIPIGGLRMIDKGEADDKIIAVLKDDAVYGQLTELADCPPKLLDRLRHYFMTYKAIPGTSNVVGIDGIYDRATAHQVIWHSLADYKSYFGLEG